MATGEAQPSDACECAQPRRDLRIDTLKGLAIFGVLMSHSLSGGQIAAIGGLFHNEQAVPVFLILFGMNLAGSMRRHGMHIDRKRQLRRLLAPFAIVIVASWAVAAARWAFKGIPPQPSILYLIGLLPTGGAGNYFVPVIVGLALVGPTAYRFYSKKPRLTIFALVAAELAFETLGKPMAAHGLGDAYALAFVRFLAMLALGFWLAGGAAPSSPRNRWIWIWAAGSVAWLLASIRGGLLPTPFVAGDQVMNVFTAGYSAVVVMLGLAWLPETGGRAVNAVAALGRASFHIFLFQMLYYRFTPRHYGSLAGIAIDLTVPLVIGWALSVADDRVGLSRRRPDPVRGVAA